MRIKMTMVKGIDLLKNGKKKFCISRKLSVKGIIKANSRTNSLVVRGNNDRQLRRLKSECLYILHSVKQLLC